MKLQKYLLPSGEGFFKKLITIDTWHIDFKAMNVDILKRSRVRYVRSTLLTLRNETPTAY